MDGHGGTTAAKVRALARAGFVVAAGRPLREAGAMVLGYHDVGTDPARATKYSVTPKRFRRQLESIRRWGLTIVPLADLLARLTAGETVDGLVAVTFDDALVGVHRHALPVLTELCVPATVFAVSGALGDTPPWWPSSDRTMTPQELGEVHAAGVQIGGHTHSHPVLPGEEDASLRVELSDSRARLEDLVGDTVDVLAYPYGEHDARVRDAVRDAGYRAGFTFLNGRVTPDVDDWRVPRLNMTEGQRALRFAFHLVRPAATWPDTQVDGVTAAG
jgi:peptidoglycan/xylan/chitin deacetylase (PgdA/CDA1 family)